MKKKVLITGGSGFIGHHLSDLLNKKGYEVSILSRSNKENTSEISYYKWNVDSFFIDEQALLEADFIINLAGENIAKKKWTAERKTSIIESRVQAIQLIYDVLHKNNKKLEAFISASAIGIYGAYTSLNIFSEESPLADDFLGTTCQKWEAAADHIAYLKIRTVKIRTGLVLGKDDGFLKKLIPIFKFRFGSAIGSGKQYMPWIHINDLCAIYLKAIEDEQMKGAYNAAIKDGTTNALFSEKLARIYGYRVWLPNIPSFLIKIVMGERSLLLLTGQRVSSDKIEKTGFKFEFDKLERALKDCLGK